MFVPSLSEGDSVRVFNCEEEFTIVEEPQVANKTTIWTLLSDSNGRAHTATYNNEKKGWTLG